MAVEIPVIIDIEGAFADAASRVGAAMKPLQREISKEALEVEVSVELDEDGDKVTETLGEILKKGKTSMSELSKYIDTVQEQLVGLSQTGDKDSFAWTLEAYHYLKDMGTAASVSKNEIEGLANTFNGLNARVSAARQTMEASAIGSDEWMNAVVALQEASEAANKLQKEIDGLGRKAGSLDSLNAELSDIREKLQSMGESEMFNADGTITKSAQKTIDKYTELSLKIERRNKLIEEGIEKERKAAAEAQRKAEEEERAILREIEAQEKRDEAERKHKEALSMAANSMQDLNTKLAAWQQELNTADIYSAKFIEAAHKAAELKKEIQEVSIAISQFGMNTRSIDLLNSQLQEMNMQFNALSASDRQGTEGQRLLDRYRQVSQILKTEGKTLSQIVAEEEQALQKERQRAEAIQKNVDRRKYEERVLKLVGNNMRVLQEQERILSERLKKANFGSDKYAELSKRLDEVRFKMQTMVGSVDNVTNSFNKQTSAIGRMIKYSLRLVALHSATSFVQNIRSVTAEFELQRVALGGIIQDTEKANALFRQIKAAAIESPFEIKDLVSYTKQLSAYRVETENLFDVTMRLADISAGLGVDMSRLVLAYGQVRAASVLRGQELRQFTEAGIPLVDLLAQKFSELNGKMVSTAEVFDLISKRQVPFEMIADIFEDMTEKGGVFYKMQEKQADTLAGQWANLRDALSIMYDEIGNTAAVHSAMETLIGGARNLMRNWRTVATILGSVISSFVAMKAAVSFLPTLRKNTELIKDATLAFNKAKALERASIGKSNVLLTKQIEQLKAYAKWMEKAGTAQTAFGRGAYQLMAKFAGGGWAGIAAMGISVLVGWMISAIKESQRLNNELKKIETNSSLSITRSVTNFNRLADAAVNAADGSSEQVKAIEELRRTYGDIIPEQKLQVDVLREMKGEYNSLTNAIREKIKMQQLEQSIDTITDYYSSKITKKRKQASNYLEYLGLDKDQIRAVLDEVQQEVEDGVEDIDFNAIVKKLTGLTTNISARGGAISADAFRELTKLAELYKALNDEVQEITDNLSNDIGVLGTYSEAWEKVSKSISDVQVEGNKFSFEVKEKKVEQQVEVIKSAIENAFAKTGIDISSAINGKNIDFDWLISKAKELFGTGEEGYYGFSAYLEKIQDEYKKIVPTNKMVDVVKRKFQDVADEVGLSMDDVQGYLLSGETDMRTFAKDISDSLQKAKDTISDIAKRKEDIAKSPNVALPLAEGEEEEAEKLLSFLTKISEWLNEYNKKGKKGAYEQDPYIKMLQERVKFMKDFKKGYDDLNKYMASSSALAKESDVMLTRGLSIGIGANEQKRAAEELSQWYQDSIDAAWAKVQKDYNVKSTLTDFLSKTITGTENKDKALRDFQALIQSLFDAKTDFDISQMTKNFDKALEDLKNQVKRSETAKNFFNDILGLTGDIDLATTLSVNVYGTAGSDFRERMAQQLQSAFAEFDKAMKDTEVEGIVQTAIDTQDFDTILQYINYFPEEWQKMLRQMASDSEKYNADQIKTWFDELKKAKTYSEQRVEISKKTAQRIQEINKSSLPQEQKDILIKQYTKKEADEVAKAQYEAFKDSPIYVEMFSNLDAASTKMLRNMKTQLEGMKEAWKNLDPNQLKELQSRIQEIDSQLAKKSPFKTIIDALKAYKELGGLSGRKEADRNASEKLDAWRQEQQVLDIMALQYETAVKRYGVEAEITKALKEQMEAQSKNVDKAKDESDKASEAAQKFREVANAIKEGAEGLKEWEGYINTLTSSASDLVNAFGTKEQAEYFEIISEGFEKTASGAVTAASGIARAISGDLTGIVDAIKGIVDMVVGIANLINGINIKQIDKRIKAYEKDIKNLEKSYERLEKAMAKAFGTDYIYNYQQQLKILEAEAEAYAKQAELEASKGKQADQDVIDDCLDKAEEAKEKIQDMQGQLAEFFTGTDLTSAARDFATAWIDAYKSFASTTGALKDKFREMIENMVVNSLAAQGIQKILEPLFKTIDEMYAEGASMEEVLTYVEESTGEYVDRADAYMNALIQRLKAAGINLRSTSSSMSGISKDIAGASEESINGLAAGINTQNFYMSYVPIISANVEAIAMALTGMKPTTATSNLQTAASSVASTTFGDETFRGQMLRIDENIADMRQMLRSVITPKAANTNTHSIGVKS